MSIYKISNNNPELLKVIDFSSVGVAALTIVEILPAIAALFTIIWTGIRIYETETVQKFITRLKIK